MSKQLFKVGIVDRRTRSGLEQPTRIGTCDAATRALTDDAGRRLAAQYRRLGNPSLSVASPDADFITGQTIDVDGGKIMH
jgi:NAD(P)-dependent dehydrogenase (short-subunit alcohol dehydrogenase family)